MQRSSRTARFVAAGAALTLATLMASVGDARQSDTGTIRGVVRAEGASPLPPLTVNADQAFCGNSLPDERLVVGTGGGVANAAVIVSGTSGGDAREPVVTNRGCAFRPRVQLGTPGGSIGVGSEDPILHNTHALDEADYTLFNLAIPFQGRIFKRPLRDSGVVRLKCDVHSWMRGFVIVTDELAAVTDGDGRFELSGVPAGVHEVRVWHEVLEAPPQTITVPAGGVAEVTWSLRRP